MSKLGRRERQGLLDEALKRVAGPEERRRISAVARSYAGGRCELEDEAQLSVYIGGPLYQAVAEVVSEQAAEAMMAFLAPVLNTWLTQSTSGAWRKRALATAPASSQPLVLMVAEPGDNRDLVVRMLCNEGYAVLCAADGKEAITRCRERRPSIVVADSGISGPVDARRLVQLIRLGLGEAMPPVIMLDDDCTEQPAGVAEVVEKRPYPTKLLGIVKQVTPIAKQDHDQGL